MRKTRLLAALLAVCLPALPAFSSAESPTPLDMNSTAIAPAPKDECYLSDNEYRDETIHVTLSEGDFQGVHYHVAHIRISDPSQLRAVPAAQANNPNASFSPWSTNEASPVRMAQVANAVVAVNGDFISSHRVCQIALRQGQQIRNVSKGLFDVLVIDRSGDFIILPACTKEAYAQYYNENAENMYQALCFGPALVMDGKGIITEDYVNEYVIANNQTARAAICQIGPLEYAVVTSDGDVLLNKFGLTVFDFSLLCEEIGYRFSPEGFRVAYNIDGGNSAALVFKRRDEEGNLAWQKVNMPERGRSLADMICFVTLVP